jgi:hypothetical protein
MRRIERSGHYIGCEGADAYGEADPARPAAAAHVPTGQQGAIMKGRALTTGLAVAAASAGLIAGCGGSSGNQVVPAQGGLPAHHAPTTNSGLLKAVPGSDNNTYIVGPFKVAMVGSFRQATPLGGSSPQQATEVHVTNVSRSFTGSVEPTVEYVQGHSLKGPVVDTETADSPASASPVTLSPGQSATLYAFPSLPSPHASYTFAMTQVSYWNAAGPEHDITQKLNTGGPT